MELKVKDGTYVFDVQYKDGEVDEFQVRYCRPEARDFRYHFHVTDNLGERGPSQVTTWQFCVVIRKPLDHGGAGKRIPNWKSKTSRLLHLFEADS